MQLCFFSDVCLYFQNAKHWRYFCFVSIDVKINCNSSAIRIDYLLLSNSLLENIVDSTIHSITISDHAPVSLSFCTISIRKSKFKWWSFNNSLLKDNKFVTLIQQNIKEFIELNMTPTTPIQTVWEAFKATRRGWIISFSSYKKKDKLQKKYELLSRLKDLELKHMGDPNNNLLKRELLLARAEAQAMMHEESAFALYKLRRKHSENEEAQVKCSHTN